MSVPAEQGQKIRLDKWLWFARVAKTRTIAKKLVLAGKIRIDGVKSSSPSTIVKPDDTLTITLPRRILVHRLLSVGTRRGPASEAELLYEDLSPPVVQTTPLDKPARQAAREEGSGRPTKRERRKISKFRFNAGEEF
jgi:ribosome-associated heat shock protein Hsp15